MSWESLQGDGVTLVPSTAESARFALRLARLTVGWDVRPGGRVPPERCADEVTAALTESDADIVVVRYPAQSLALAAATARSGRAVLAAGSLTYWSVPVTSLVTPAAQPDLEVVRLADWQPGADERRRSALLDDLVADSFAAYDNHYAADPLLDRELALAGYQEWARGSALGNPRDALLLLLDHEPVGMATLAEGRVPTHHLEVLLAGLRGSAQGRGRYGTLLARAVHDAADRGAEELVISTQTHNVRVQRAWARLGLRPLAAIETLHAVRPELLAGHRG